MRQRFRLLGLFVLASLSLTACASGGSSDATAGPDTGTGGSEPTYESCAELVPIGMDLYQQVLDMMEGVTVEQADSGELAPGLDESRAEQLESNFGELDDLAAELECGSTEERSAYVVICPSVGSLEADGEAAEEFLAELEQFCAPPVILDLPEVGVSAWGPQACESQGRWYSVLVGWYDIVQVPDGNGGFEPSPTNSEFRAVVDTYLGDLIIATDLVVAELTALGLPDIEDGAAIASAQIQTYQTISAEFQMARDDLSEVPADSMDFDQVGGTILRAAEPLEHFDAAWGEALERNTLECLIDDL